MAFYERKKIPETDSGIKETEKTLSYSSNIWNSQDGGRI